MSSNPSHVDSFLPKLHVFRIQSRVCNQEGCGEGFHLHVHYAWPASLSYALYISQIHSLFPPLNLIVVGTLEGQGQILLGSFQQAEKFWCCPQIFTTSPLFKVALVGFVLLLLPLASLFLVQYNSYDLLHSVLGDWWSVAGLIITTSMQYSSMEEGGGQTSLKKLCMNELERWVTGNDELTVGVGNQAPGPLQEQQVLLMARPLSCV